MPTRKQIGYIKALCKDRFDRDDDYRDFLEKHFGVRSSLKLKTPQISQLIDLLKGKRQTAKYYGAGSRGSQINLTVFQAERIELLESLLGWDEKRLLGFIERQLGKKKAVQWLMNYEATKVITGLQKLWSENDDELYKSINDMGAKELRKFVELSKNEEACNA